jgi:hypothetical protein
MLQTNLMNEEQRISRRETKSDEVFEIYILFKASNNRHNAIGCIKHRASKLMNSVIITIIDEFCVVAYEIKPS